MSEVPEGNTCSCRSLLCRQRCLRVIRMSASPVGTVDPADGFLESDTSEHLSRPVPGVRNKSIATL